MKEKLYTIPLNDAVNASDECPFCFIERELEQNSLDFVLGNSSSYMESDIRDQTDKAGFCRVHMKKMFDYGNTLGNALILQTHYHKLREEMRKQFDSFSPGKSSVLARFRRSDSSANKNPIAAWTAFKDCSDNECRHKCVLCRKFRCSDVCKFYKPRECEKLNKPPYVCNGCSKKTNCMMDKKIYSSKYAQDTYEALRTTSREGINQTPESIQKLDILLSPLLKKGQSIAHIYASHADEIACSRRTIYSYIDRGVFQARNIDLRRKVVYKQRKRKTTASLKDRSFRKDRSYKEFLEYIAANKSVYVVEMDTVEGAKGTSPCFLTMFFRNCSLMLMFLLEEQTQKEVTRIFDHLTELLGIELFQKLFEVILTDNGHEFQDRQSLEYSKNGEVRTRIYYCDPNRSDQKGALEKNHEYIRYVLPKGTSFEKMTDKTTLLLLNHINSEKRDSLNGHSPYEVSRLLLDNRLHKALGLAEIPADEVTLIPALIK